MLVLLKENLLKSMLSFNYRYNASSSAVKSKRGAVKVKIVSYPKEGSDRTEFDTKNGKIFTIAQWYPRMCV
jgi:hypothetical protein